jgi:MoaA/NifB/PqqE/SkfB family radical SAM enzyme
MNQETFCIHSHIGVNIRTDGTLTPCCNYQIKDGNLVDKYDQFDRWRQTKVIKISQELDNGQRHEGCSRCWDEEDNGSSSYRINGNRTFENFIRQDFSPDKSYGIKHLHVEFGNHCNLKCIMCNPYCSSSIETEVKMNREQYKNFVHLTHDDQFIQKRNWFETDEYQELEPRLLENVEHIFLTGGEPLITPNAIAMLKSIPHPEQLNLTVTTNGTTLTDEVYDCISKFKSVAIVVSLEGTEQHTEYVRYGSEWATVDANIKKLATRPNPTWPNNPITIGHTLQYTSFWALIPLIQYCVDNSYAVNVGRLMSKPYLDIEVLTDAQRNQFILDLQELKSQIPLTHYLRYNYISAIKFTINSLENAVHNPNLINTFNEYIGMLDRIRKTNFREVFPV